MKAVVFFLALLAALKLGHQEYLYRTATSDVIIGAYRERAVQACQRDGRGTSYGLAAHAWANPESIRLVIGKSNLDVRLWQIDHQLWNAKFRNPYLVLTAPSRSGSIYCEYDVVHAAASLYRL
jgi:hypothetical protein